MRSWRTHLKMAEKCELKLLSKESGAESESLALYVADTLENRELWITKALTLPSKILKRTHFQNADWWRREPIFIVQLLAPVCKLSVPRTVTPNGIHFEWILGHITVAKIKTGRSVFHDWLNTAHTFYLKSMSILKSFKNSTYLDQAETSSLSRFEMT